LCTVRKHRVASSTTKPLFDAVDNQNLILEPFTI
jgi:hypothetical protein